MGEKPIGGGQLPPCPYGSYGPDSDLLVTLPNVKHAYFILIPVRNTICTVRISSFLTGIRIQNSK